MKKLAAVLVLLAAPSCGDDGGGGGGGTPDATVAQPPDADTRTACEIYCANAIANCTGDDAIFADSASCAAACAAMPEGSAGDTSGNTAHCRAYHAGAAATDAPTHCPHASISSDSNVCGSACDAYCDQVMANCTGDNELYADRAACGTACAGWTAGAWDDTGDDSVQCRAYHASFPAAGDAALHCPHAAADGGGVCVGSST